MIFRKIPQLVKVFREKILSWVLVPAVFLGTLPHTGCICADGHREENCQALTCRISTTRPTKANQCACCGSKSASSGAQSCCQAQQNESDTCNKLVAPSGFCCNPIIEAPAPAVTAGKVEVAAKSVLVATIEPENWFRSADNFWPALNIDELSTPPPIDVTIVYLHLTI